MGSYISSLKNKLGLSKPKPQSKIESYIAKYLDVSKKLVFIDIGAHRGDFVNELEKYYRIAKAILIEPIPELAVYLKSKFSRNGFTIFQNAITNKDLESVEFKINVYGETSSILEFKTEMKELSNVDTRLEKNIRIDTRTLDSIVKELNFGKIDLIKIDVQGAEHLVLEGGKKTLQNSSYVWIEMSFKPLYIGSSVFHDIYSIMEHSGFILLEISPGHRSPNKELLQADALFVNSKVL